jgi:hypothetical protein
MNLQHFVAGSCHFNGSAAFLSPTLVFQFLQCDGARLSLVALQVVLAGGVGLGVGFVFLVCWHVGMLFVGILACWYVGFLVRWFVLVIVIVNVCRRRGRRGRRGRRRLRRRRRCCCCGVVVGGGCG